MELLTHEAGNLFALPFLHAVWEKKETFRNRWFVRFVELGR